MFNYCDLISVTVTEQLDPKHLGDEKVYLAYPSQPQTVTEGRSQAETMEDYCWLGPGCSLPNPLSYMTQDLLPRGIIHVS